MSEPQNPFSDMPDVPVAPDPAQAQAQSQAQAQAQSASQAYQNAYGQPQQTGSQPYGQDAYGQSAYGQTGSAYTYGQGTYQGQQTYSGYTQSATGQYTPGYQQSPYQQAYQQPVAPAQPAPLYPMTETDRNLRLVAFIFNILSLVGSCWLIIPLAWMIPMCVISWGIYKGTKANTVAFGVCTLIFLNFVGGILLLCSNKDR